LLTVTVNDFDVLLPAASVAAQPTVEVPTGNVPPVLETPLTPGDEDEQVVDVTPTRSVAVTEYVTAAVVLLVVVVMLAGTLSVGAVVSLTVTVKVALPVLPAESVAVQVTGVAPSLNVLPEAGVQVVATEPLTESVADAAKLTTAPAALVASAVMFAGTVTAGFVVSKTVTVRFAVPVLPAPSVAKQVTVVVPRGNVLPEAGVQFGISAPLTRSVADAVKLTTAPEALVASAVMGAGTVTTGFVVSLTVTVKLALPVLPAVSVAVQVTVVLPSANVLPEAGVQFSGTEPLTRSVADVV